MLVAAAAMTFFGCQKPEVVAPEVAEEVMLTFASEKPAFDDATKTEWTGETIQWSAGDKISIAYTVDGIWQNASGNASGDARLYKSDALVEAKETAQFNVSAYFTGETEGTHVFYGVYPAPSETGFANAPVAVLTVAPSQNPKADSFDSNGDLMLGVSDVHTARPTADETISMRWERMVAHAVITLKNINGLTSEETLEAITLTAQADANLVGQQKVNLLTKEVTKDNDAANVLKVFANNLTAVDGNVTFWACMLPETVTSLTVEVATDKATYTREITGIGVEFMKNARNLLSIKMDEAVRVANTVNENEVVDVLNNALTGITGTNYTNWSGKTSVSDAVYAGQSAGGNESIQLRSNNNNSGVVTTTSGGLAKKVVVSWNSNTASGRTLNVYGSNSAYSNPTDLYGDNKGTLLGTIKCGTSTELAIDGNYEYIGMRSASGAMYIEEIKITWLTGSSEGGDTPEEPVEPETPVDPTPDPEEPATPTVVTIAEFLATQIGDKEYKLTGVMTGTYNTTYGNFYLEDETGKVLVYGLTKNKVSENDKSFASLNLRDGDTVTLIGKRAEYNGTAQVGGPAYYVSHVVAPYFELAATTGNVAYAATTYTVNFESNLSWTAEGSTGVSLDKTSGENGGSVVMTFDANETDVAKTHTVTFTAGENTSVFTLTQSAKPAEGGAETPSEPVVLLSENFSSLTNWSTTDVSSLTVNDLVWTRNSGKMYAQNGCIKFGSGTAAQNTGVKLPKLTSISGTTNVRLTFKAVSSAGAYTISVTSTTGSVGTLAPASITKYSTAINSGASTAEALKAAFDASTEFSVDITGVTSATDIIIKVEASAKQWYIDDVKVVTID